MNTQYTKRLTSILLISMLLITHTGTASEDQTGSQRPQTLPRTGTAVKSSSWTLTDPMQLFTKAMPRLKLNPEKRRIIRDILENHQEALAQARTTFSKAVQTMNQMALETENEEDIRTAATDVGQALGDLMVLSANIYIELKEELTPEQQTILKNMNKPLQRSLPQRRNKLLQKKRDTEK